MDPSMSSTRQGASTSSTGPDRRIPVSKIPRKAKIRNCQKCLAHGKLTSKPCKPGECPTEQTCKDRCPRCIKAEDKRVGTKGRMRETRKRQVAQLTSVERQSQATQTDTVPSSAGQSQTEPAIPIYRPTTMRFTCNFCFRLEADRPLSHCADCESALCKDGRHCRSCRYPIMDIIREDMQHCMLCYGRLMLSRKKEMRLIMKQPL